MPEMKLIQPTEDIPAFSCDVCGVGPRTIGVSVFPASWIQTHIDGAPLDICNECILAMSAICPPNAQQLPPKKLLAALIVANMKALGAILTNEPTLTNARLLERMTLVVIELEKML